MKVTHAPLVVSDQERALEFFTGTLGFEKRADYKQPGRPRWLTVAPKGQELEFILVEGKSKVDLGLGPEAGTGGYQIAFTTTACRKDFETLRAKGVDFKVGTYTTPVQQAWGISASFKDPDGNQFVLIQPNLIGKAYTAANRRKARRRAAKGKRA